MKKTISIGIVLMLVLTVVAGIIAFPTVATSPYPIKLYAGQDNEVGHVEVSNNGDNLYVKYVIDDTDWCITETHLSVQCSIDEIPQTQPNRKGNGGGNPIPGQFEFSRTYNPPVPSDEYIVEIPDCEDEELFIAAHAVVERSVGVCADFEEYDEYEEVSSVSTPKGDMLFYMTDYSLLGSTEVGDVVGLLPTGSYPIVAVENTKNPDHDWMDLTMMGIVGFTVGNTFEDDWVKADPDNTGAGGKMITDVPDDSLDPFWQHAYSNFEAIVINVSNMDGPVTSLDFAGIDLDWNEVWTILYVDDSGEVIHKQVMGPPAGQSLDGYAVPVLYEGEPVSKMVIWGNMNSGTPGKVGFAIDNVCVNVVEEETAWGATAVGQTPFPGKNWATYFMYQIDGCAVYHLDIDSVNNNPGYTHQFVITDCPTGLTGTGDSPHAGPQTVSGIVLDTNTISFRSDYSGSYFWYPSFILESDGSLTFIDLYGPDNVWGATGTWTKTWQ